MPCVLLRLGTFFCFELGFPLSLRVGCSGIRTDRAPQPMPKSAAHRGSQDADERRYMFEFQKPDIWNVMAHACPAHTYCPDEHRGAVSAPSFTVSVSSMRAVLEHART